MPLTIAIEPHPLLDAGMFEIRFGRPLSSIETPDVIAQLCRSGAAAPLSVTDNVKSATRALLRHTGYKPSGRSKPASEYLAAAFAEQRFPRINAGVDICNVVSLWSGLPISVVDVDRLVPPLAIRAAPPGTTYAFNPSGQVIDAGGLLCLYDADGPSGTPVKDAQRTKTHDDSQNMLAIVWGTHALPGRTAETVAWYRSLVEHVSGASLHTVVCT